MARFVVAGNLVRFPLAGASQFFLSYLVGLRQLGHDVYFVERASWPNACFDVSKREMTDDCSYGIAVAHALLERHGLGDRWCFVDAGGRYHGLSLEHVRSAFNDADVFLDLEWDEWLTEAAAAGLRVVIEGEPAWRQMKMENSARAGERLPEYDYYYTMGPNIGTPRSDAPTAGKSWGKTVCPVMIDAIPFEPHTGDGPFSTVMRWRSNRPVTFNGITYGQKDVEFPKFIDLPRLTRVPVEMAVSGRIPTEIRDQLLDAGWRLRHADDVAVTLDSYREYIRSSRGEFAVCKHVHVANNTGVLPDRPGWYMASGRPAVVQDTGFSEHLPCGRGLFAVRTVEEAAAAIETITADYMTHARAAREIAAEYLDAKKVLAKLIKEIGIS